MVTILERYNNYDNLITVDIFNEYQGLDYNELNALYSDTIQHIENKFLIVLPIILAAQSGVIV